MGLLISFSLAFETGLVGVSRPFFFGCPEDGFTLSIDLIKF
jgi:hypothetical protein